ncbi:MAG: hypothetical protein HC824_21440 [Synechococcales cyanobacterium RM1_1_8]|nr:hypothetical protein [Synechococcales cyanobacterium RM1_1_8]
MTLPPMPQGTTWLSSLAQQILFRATVNFLQSLQHSMEEILQAFLQTMRLQMAVAASLTMTRPG